MSHQDSQSSERLNAAYLKQALQWLLAGVNWKAVRFRNDCSWTPKSLVSAALLWAWSDEGTLIERFSSARRIVAFLFPEQDEPATSYQAFSKMLRRWTEPLVCVIVSALRQRMMQALTTAWLFEGYVMFGVDGSRVDLPRTASHEAAFAASRPSGKRAGKRRKPSRGGTKKRRRRSSRVDHSRKADTPQMWLTTMWHAGTGLPWDWRTDPADSSERADLLDILPALPDGALIAGDAGFVGYEYAREIIASGRHCLIRVGSNVRLLRKLGYVRETAGTVYLWPDYAARKSQPPVVLRLVVANNGRHPVYLVTSLLSTRDVSDACLLKLYAKRWGIEVFYRSLKQTFGRRKLRSLTPDQVQLELTWSLIGLWAMSLYALVQTLGAGIAPHRLSVAGVLRCFRRMLRDYRHPCEPGHSLCARLRDSIIDDYHRSSKASRDYPRRKRESPPGAPQITNASRTQTQNASRIRGHA